MYEQLLLPSFFSLVVTASMLALQATAGASDMNRLGRSQRVEPLQFVQAQQSEGHIVSINIEERTLLVRGQDGLEKEFKVAPNAQVTRNEKEVTFGELAMEGFVVLHFLGPESRTVTRIQAVAKM